MDKPVTRNLGREGNPTGNAISAFCRAKGRRSVYELERLARPANPGKVSNQSVGSALAAAGAGARLAFGDGQWADITAAQSSQFCDNTIYSISD